MFFVILMKGGLTVACSIAPGGSFDWHGLLMLISATSYASLTESNFEYGQVRNLLPLPPLLASPSRSLRATSGAVGGLP